MLHIRPTIALPAILLVAAASGVLAACHGDIGGAGGQDPAGSDPSGAVPGAGNNSGSATGPTGMRRLTRGQYETSIRSLLGPDVAFSADLTEVPVSQQAADVDYTTQAAARVIFSQTDVDALFDTSMAIVGPLFDDAGRRKTLVGCEPTKTTDPCVRTFVSSFAKRAFRRPIENEEVDRYVTVATNAAANLSNNVWQGVGYAVAAIVQSPSFLYVVENGEQDPANAQRLRYTNWEMASRLSLYLGGSLPDDALMAAADAGKLTDAGEVRAQATRLLGTDGGRQNVTSGFFHEFFNTDAMAGTGKDTATYPTWTPALGASMLEELRQVLDDGVFTTDTDFGAMLIGRTTFVDSSLATLYGLPAPSGTGFQKTTIPDGWARAGLLGTGAFLAMNSRPTRTSPTLRGKFIAERLLCTPVPPPPPNVPALTEGDTDAGPQTIRQKMEAHRANPACSGCHAVMDPPGFALEHFDSIGAYRETENGLTIDATGQVNGKSFDGAVAFATTLSTMPQVRSCLSRQAFRYLAGRREPAANALDGIAESTHGHVKALVVELVASDFFRLVPTN